MNKPNKQDLSALGTTTRELMTDRLGVSSPWRGHPPACGAVPRLWAAAVIRGLRSAHQTVEDAPPGKSHSLDRRHLGLDRPPSHPPERQAPQACGRSLEARSETAGGDDHSSTRILLP